MSIENRIEKLENRNKTQNLKVIVGTDADIERYESMDDRSFYEKFGIDRSADNLIIYLRQFA
jgi:hypothetical protein